MLKKFLLPKWNYEKSVDEWKILQDKGIAVVSVSSQIEVWEHSLGAKEDQIIQSLRITTNHVEIEPEKSRSI
jgi:hypothetical protein